MVLIGGGSRSGKSRFALDYARRCGSRLAFIATAQAYDDEMRDRIRNHQLERDAAFTTFEEPFDIPGAIRRAAGCDALVIDCLTLWVSNLMLAGNRDIVQETAALVEAAEAAEATLIFVTNEVGCGIVPENELARRFRDEAGRVNQMIGAAAREVYWMAFGIPMRAK